MALGVCLYFEVGQVLFGGRLKLVMPVNNGQSRITPCGGSEEEPQLVGLAHEALYRLCHNSHPLSLNRVKQCCVGRLGPVPIFYARRREKAPALPV